MSSILEELLAWGVAMGADEAIGDVPIDRQAEEARRIETTARTAIPAAAMTAIPAAIPAQAPTRVEPARQAAPVAPSATGRASHAPAAQPAFMAGGPVADGIAAARAAAAAANSLAELAEAVAAFEGCSLKRTATNTVFADGTPESRIMFLGEAPGADEDRLGRPFVGVSGQLLDRMLACIGLDRARNAYITNVLFWRPPGNRKPTESEVALCRPFVERHIQLVNPRVLVLVGGTSASAMLPGSAGITRIRGRWQPLDVPGLQRPVETMPIYHPSFLLRSPERKREAWQDLLSLKEKLGI